MSTCSEQNFRLIFSPQVLENHPSRPSNSKPSNLTMSAEDNIEAQEQVAEPEADAAAPTKSTKEQRDAEKAPKREANTIFDMTGWVCLSLLSKKRTACRH